MAILTSEDLKTLDYVFNGEPFCEIHASGFTDTYGMELPFNGEPFITNPQPTVDNQTGNFFLFF